MASHIPCYRGGCVNRFLGTSGQNVDDIYKFCTLSDRLEILHRTLEWSHMAPTAPDTLGEPRPPAHCTSNALKIVCRDKNCITMATCYLIASPFTLQGVIHIQMMTPSSWRSVLVFTLQQINHYSSTNKLQRVCCVGR